MKKETKISSINYHSKGDDVDVYYTQLTSTGSRASFKVTLDGFLMNRLNKSAGLIKYLEDEENIS